MMSTPNTLLDPVFSYPVFQPNQVLTDGDLRDVVDYFDQQTRLTRLRLLGAGIVCGLLPRWRDDALLISSGCGVTSEGFLIHLEQSRLEHYEPKQLSRDLFLGQQPDTGQADTDTDVKIEAFELFETAREGETTPLTELFAKEKVVVLLLEITDAANKSCADDCDENGTQRRFNIRKLLLESHVADELLLANYSQETVETLKGLFGSKYGLTDLYLERFGYTAATDADPASANLTSITSHELFIKRYRTILLSGAERVAAAIKDAHRVFSPLFSRFVPGSGELPELPPERFEPSEMLHLQCLYGHLSDLILAYDEFREVAFDVMDACDAETHWFPRHLFLGQPLDVTPELPIPPAVNRTPYFQPPVYNGNRSRADAARLLFERLGRLINAFEVPIAGEIRITPSKYGDAPLSERAIPFYYNPKSRLNETWNCDRHRKARNHRIFSYYRLPAPGKQIPNSPFDDPLVFDFEAYNFFRIEGHVGLDLERAEKRIRELREYYNLPFDIVFLKLGDELETEYQHDCEIEILEAQYAKLRTDLKCAIEAQDSDRFEVLLDTLKETLDEFEYRVFDKAFREFAGESDCLLGYDKHPFKQLDQLHNERKQAVKGQDLFHGFAAKHPGMEHRAGVPRGGTFALVYHERNRTDKELKGELESILSRFRGNLPKTTRDQLAVSLQQVRVRTVVADFCLPYLCNSDCPPTAFVIARPRPTLALEKTAFCADDDERYLFIVNPPGGKLDGAGTRQTDYSFVPNETELEEGTVEVTYSVDGVDATLLLTILPIPEIAFKMPKRICPERFRLEGTPPGGEYTTAIDEGNPKLGIVDTATGVFFDPTISGVPPEKPIQITYRVTNEHGCTADTMQVTHVNAVDAGFTGLKKGYCNDSGGDELKPIDETLISEFIGNGVNDRFFNPQKVDFQGPRTEVTVTHRVADQDGCKAEETQVTTVHRRPERVSFSIAALPASADSFNFQIDGITPRQTADDVYQYVFEWDGGHFRTPDSNPFILTIPKEDLQNHDLLVVQLIVSNGPCSGQPVIRETDIRRDEDRPGPDNPLRDPVEITDEFREFLARRRRQRLEEISELARQHDELGDTRAFDEVKTLLSFADDRSSEELVKQYEKTLGFNIRAYNQTDDVGRKEAYGALIAMATARLLDGFASTPTDEATRKVAVAQFEKLRESQIDLEAIWARWRTDDATNVFDPARVAAIDTLLPSIEP